MTIAIHVIYWLLVYYDLSEEKTSKANSFHFHGIRFKVMEAATREGGRL